jgi:hypothetical protein
MAKIKIKVRKHTHYIIDIDGKEYEVNHEPLDYLDTVVRALPNGITVIGYLAGDTEPSDPRECDQLGKMICWHRRYTLGDKHSYADPEAFWNDLLGEDAERLNEEEEAEYSKWWEDHPTENHSGKAIHEFLCEQRKRHRDKIQELIKAKDIVILPLYLYDHSGITMSTGRFSDPWDSGQVGYIYTNAELAKEVGAPRDSWEAQLEAEVKEYDLFITNEAYGVCVEVFDKDGNSIEDEACWGFLGGDYAEQELKAEVERTVKSHGGN